MIRALLILAAVLVVGAIAFIGSVTAYHSRHRGEHRERLQRLLTDHPTETQLHEILGTPWHAGTPDEAASLARAYWSGGPAFSISPDLARRSTRTLIYHVGDMVYLIFLDPTGAMVDFILLYS